MSEELRSIGEIIDEMGLGKPREPMPIDYNRDAQEHWDRQRPKIWSILLANGVPIKLVNDLQELQGNGRFEESVAVQAVERFLKSYQKLLVLLGDPQVGKSLACAYGLSTRTVTRRTQFGAEEWRTWRYWDSDFKWLKASQLGARLDFSDSVAMKARADLAKVGLLVIDEVGGAAWGDISKKLDDLIGERWANDSRTILTSNLDPQGLREVVGDRIAERIRKVGKVVECRWLDRP